MYDFLERLVKYEKIMDLLSEKKTISVTAAEL